MKSNSHLNTDDYFKKHFQDAKSIRAICDDLHFPAEYSPVFINIHIRGTAHFKSPPLPKEFYSMIFSFLDPESDIDLKDILPHIHTKFLNEKFDHLNIKDQMKKWDNILTDTNIKPHYFSDQLKMISKLYSDDEYMDHMITLYTFFIQPLIKEYDEDRIQSAFYRGLIREINEEINDYYKWHNPDE